LNKGNNYNCEWSKQDTVDLFELLVNSGFRFAISEVDSDEILELADKYNLNIYVLCEMQHLKKRSNEILIVNYDAKKQMKLL